MALEAGCRRIVSVETDLAWIKNVSDNPAISKAIKAKRLTMHHVDIGPIGAWGRPTDDSKIRNWPKYIVDPFLKYSIPYDLILVDGRLRQACAYAAHAFMLEDTRLLVHDYTTREKYSDIEKFFNVEDKADQLVVFRKKERIVESSLYRSVLTTLFDL